MHREFESHRFRHKQAYLLVCLFMALSFKKLKSPLLDMTDKIPVGKLRDCRVCDVIQDHYEYLIWANKQGLLHFTKLVAETIAEHAGFKNQQVHYAEEVAPYVEPHRESDYIEIDLEDLPF